MDIKTDKSRDAQSTRIVPPPDTSRRHKKKTPQKIGKNHVAGRRFVAALKTLGKTCVLFLTALFMVSVVYYAYNSEKFNLRKVTFYGCKQLDRQEMEESIRQNFPKNILRIDLGRLQKHLEKETWAKRVEIRRVLPSDLVIYVEERTPSVIIEIRGELMMADADGTVLDRYDPKCKLDMPVFKGVLGENAESYRLYQEENAARIRQGLEMLTDIESGSPSYARRISEVDISDRKNLKILLVDDTAEIYLGDRDYLKRFRTLMENLNQYQELKNQYAEFSSIDMRFDGNIIYRPITANAEHGSKTQKLQGSKVKSE